MLTFLSQKLKFILVIILAIIGISFVFFGDWSGSGRGRGPAFSAKIQGHPISLTDFQHSIRASRIAYTLGTGQIPGSGNEVSRAIAQQAWTRLLLLAEIHGAGLTASPADVQEAIRKHPIFQDPAKKAFSPEYFKRFQDYVLTPQGVTLDRFFEIMRDQLLIEAWLGGLQDSAVIQVAEAEEAFRNLYGPVTMDYIQITPASVAGKIQPDDTALRGFYDKRTDRFALPEQRKVDYILIKLPANASSLPADAQTKIRRELGEKAYQFTEPFYTALENGKPAPDFVTQAKAAGLEVQTSPYFTRDGFVFSGPTGTSLAQMAFTLTPERPVSDYVQVAEGYAILHLREVQPPSVRPFETVKEEVRKAYIESETNIRLQAASDNIALNIRKDLAAGKTFAQAAAAAGQKPASLPTFVVAAQDAKGATHPLLNTARFRSMQLKPGQLSQPFPHEGNIVLLHLVSRGEPDASKQAEVLPRLKEQLLQQRRGQIREEYLTGLGERKGTTIPANLLAEGAN